MFLFFILLLLFFIKKFNFPKQFSSIKYFSLQYNFISAKPFILTKYFHLKNFKFKFLTILQSNHIQNSLIFPKYSTYSLKSNQTAYYFS